MTTEFGQKNLDQKVIHLWIQKSHKDQPVQWSIYLGMSSDYQT